MIFCGRSRNRWNHNRSWEISEKQKKSVHIVAVEPATSPVLSQGKVGPHKIQGIGAGFIPDTLDTSVYDEIIPIKNDDAFEEGRAFARSEGILVGISAGAALKAAVELAKEKKIKERTLWYCFRIPETVIYLLLCLQNKISGKASGIPL